MKIHYIVLSLALLAASACTVEPQQVESVDSQVILKAYQEGSVESKTAVVNGGTQVFWEPGDAINVFFKGTGSKFVSLNTELASVADFSGYFSGLVGANEGTGSSNFIWGLYPYRSDAVSDGQSVTTTLPDIQTAREGSFARNTHISLACALNLDLAFYNVCGGLRFSLTQEGIKSITFEGNNGEVIAGRIKLAFEGGVPTIQEITEGKTSITLKASSGTTFQTRQWYYIAALPGSLTKGFKMTFERESDSAKLTSSSNVSFKRGKYGSLADADEDLIFKGQGGNDNPGGEAPAGEIISFADEKVKAKLVAAFDTNGDGELSYEEAAAVTSIEGVFGAIKTYKSFDEFQYFTGVTTIPSSIFKEWNLLNSIVIPESVTRIGDYAFKNCTSLASIVIPESVTNIEWYAFSGCTSLASIVIPESVTNIEWYAFSGCTSLASIVIPESVTSIGDNAFENCTSLTSIVIPESVTMIGMYAFSGCTSLTSIVIPESVTTIEGDTFSGCANLTSISIPESVTTIESYMFDDYPEYGAFTNCSSLVSIVLPEKLTSIGCYAFSHCTSLSSITIPENVTSIEKYAFYGCTSLSSIVIPESVTCVTQFAFYGCTSLSSVVIPESVSRIEHYSFYGCTSLSSIVIPESVTSIGYNAFSGCTGLTSIVIPESVTTIESYVFSGCTNMISCTVMANNPPSLGSDIFYNNNCIIYVPTNSVESYKAHWSSYADRIQAIPE